MSRQAGYAFIITLLYIPLFLFLDNAGLSVQSLKQLLQSEAEDIAATQNNTTGPDTYRIDFTVKSNACPTCDSSGFLLKGGRNYSPGFVIPLQGFTHETLRVIKTQARVRRLSSDSLGFVFVVTIETPGEKEPFWAASYGLDADFAIDTPTILNGRLKLENHKINAESILKGYIWNTGESSIKIDYLEITLGADPVPNGNNTLVEQFEGEYLLPTKGYQPFLPKTKLRGHTEKKVQEITSLEDQILFSIGDVLYGMNRRTIRKLTPDGKVQEAVIPLSDHLQWTPGMDPDGNSVLYRSSAKNSWEIYRPFDPKNPLPQKIKLEDSTWIPAESHHFSNGMEIAWIEKKGNRMAFLQSGSIRYVRCKWEPVNDCSEITAFKRLTPDLFLLFVKTNDTTEIMTVELRKEEAVIHATQLEDIRHMPVLGLSAADQFFPKGNEEFIVVGRGWRFSMHRCRIKPKGSISILESYFPLAENDRLPPFYHEVLSAARYKNGLLFKAEMRHKVQSAQITFCPIP